MDKCWTVDEDWQQGIEEIILNPRTQPSFMPFKETSSPLRALLLTGLATQTDFSYKGEHENDKLAKVVSIDRDQSVSSCS